MKKLSTRFIKYVKRILKIIFRPEMKVLPGQIAFFLVLSLIPLVTVVGLIASQFSISITNFISAVTNTLPEQISNIIVPILNSPGSVSIYSVILGFYIASNGAVSIIVASNMLFKIDDKDYIKRRIKALFMLIILVLLFLFMIVVLGYGNTIFEFIINYFKIDLPHFMFYIFYAVKWTIGILIIFILVKLLLTFAPDQRVPSKKMNRGAIFITISWIVATSIYSIYVSDFVDYNVFYSSLANIVILMFWVYILSYTLVIGIAMNGENYIYEKKLEEEVRKKILEEEQENEKENLNEGNN